MFGWIKRTITEMEDEEIEYKYLGDLSAVDPPYVRHMECHDCKVSWGGCWDNFQCPKCGEGELPSNDISALKL